MSHQWILLAVVWVAFIGLVGTVGAAGASGRVTGAVATGAMFAAVIASLLLFL